VSFKRKAIGLNLFVTRTRKLALKISPQSGISDILTGGAWIIALEARDNAIAQGLIRSGELVDSIKPVKINQFRVDIKVGVPYGAAHEFGVTVTITERQRRFFWAKHIETGDPMWLALALSKTYTIPARPYLRPAIDESKASAVKQIGGDMRKAIQEAVK